MTYTRYKQLVFSDLYRYKAQRGLRSLLNEVLFGESYKYVFWFRTCAYTRSHSLLRWLVFPFARMMMRKYQYRYGIDIPYTTAIDTGFYIGHIFGIIVNSQSIIGKNCNISQGVTLGESNRGKNKGFPTLGDNVYIGPGAKIVGAVRIGNNVAIGANCVVTKDVPDNAVVVGVPGKVISMDGAEGYVNYTDYEKHLGLEP